MVSEPGVGEGLTTKRHGGDFWFYGNVHYLDCGGGSSVKLEHYTKKQIIPQ